MKHTRMFKTYIIKMKYLKNIFLGGIAFLIVSACDSNDSELDHDMGTHVSAIIKLDHSLAIGDEFTIQQQAGGENQTLILDTFKFLISDVVVKTADNQMISIPNNVAGSLIDLSKAVNKEVQVYLTEIPDGEYKSISFGIGVSDEVANGSADEQSRLFDLAAADMNWSWNPNSYIFSKIEATNKVNVMHHMAKTESEQADDLSIHIGKKGDFDGYRTVTIDLSTLKNKSLFIKKEFSPSIHIIVNIEKLFSPNDGVAVYLGAPSKVDFSDNYSSIFEAQHVHPLDEAIYLEDVEMDVDSGTHDGDGHSGHNH
jgi:hypothetical protein